MSIMPDLVIDLLSVIIEMRPIILHNTKDKGAVPKAIFIAFGTAHICLKLKIDKAAFLFFQEQDDDHYDKTIGRCSYWRREILMPCGRNSI
jgi:hypothetical protein